MSSIPDRYDLNADHYEHYWAPVLDATARRLLDRVAPYAAALPAGSTVLDVGTGSGVLALDAFRRWPSLSVIGSDASSGMLRVAAARGVQLGAPAEPDIPGEPDIPADRDTPRARGRLRWLHAPADALTLPDASVDLVVSSFAYQLVPDRGAAFREALRVLRPGGRIAFVTWLSRGDDFEPAIEFDEAVLDLDIDEPDEPDEEVRAGDFRSPRSAAGELRRAGFRRVSANVEALEHAWTINSYLDFKERYEERTLFGWLDDARAKRLLERARERFQELPPDAFTWRTDVVSAVGERPR
ncbi:MAG: hypothetical protein QOH61_893 [Chloroflexota bacterium]|nr:hypothetical protein [Chloroflexota bacterium]